MNQTAMMPCDHVIARLWEYIDAEIGSEESGRISAHLEVCARCFPQYEFQKAYKLFVAQTAHQTMPASVRRRVFEAILAEESGRALENGSRPTMADRLRALIRRLRGG
jgi:mycothiol system anti-sigma-R factor